MEIEIVGFAGHEADSPQSDHQACEPDLDRDIHYRQNELVCGRSGTKGDG
jgi:hypothetical protein